METTFWNHDNSNSLRLIATHCDSLRLLATPYDYMETRLYVHTALFSNEYAMNMIDLLKQNGVVNLLSKEAVRMEPKICVC